MYHATENCACDCYTLTREDESNRVNPKYTQVYLEQVIFISRLFSEIPGEFRNYQLCDRNFADGQPKRTYYVFLTPWKHPENSLILNHILNLNINNNLTSRLRNRALLLLHWKKPEKVIEACLG